MSSSTMGNSIVQPSQNKNNNDKNDNTTNNNHVLTMTSSSQQMPLTVNQSNNPKSIDSSSPGNSLVQDFFALIPNLPPDSPMAKEEMDELVKPAFPNEAVWIEDYAESLKNSHLTTTTNPYAWNAMGQRLRQWQVDTGEDENDDMQIDPSTTTTATITTATAPSLDSSSQESTCLNTRHVRTKQDEKFQGGVDAVIPKEERHRRAATLFQMHGVPSLSNDYMDWETKLPTRTLAVTDGSNHLIYIFRLYVKQSSIPNSGYGAFIRFLGAKELLPSLRTRNEEAEQLRQYKGTNRLHRPFPSGAIHPTLGYGIHFTITGEHLKSRYNSLYPLKTLEAIVPNHLAAICPSYKPCNDNNNNNKKKKKTRPRNVSGNAAMKVMKVQFSDPDLPLEEDEIQGLMHPEHRVGHYNLFTLNDYVDAPKRKFSSLYPNCGLIDIGHRYGPFVKDDRKMELNFEAKSFVFGFEPNMWGFGVEEPILGRKQVIDITDNTTGEPHAIARNNIPMYVNEKGHNPTLVQNVEALSVEDRIIKYFLRIEEPMVQGEEREMLVDYKEVYEGCRERKGYGANNLQGLIHGDDHFPTLLRRNFLGRDDLIHELGNASVMDFYLLVTFCREELAETLHQLGENFLNEKANTENNVVLSITSRQLVALRRLDWLATILCESSVQLKEKAASVHSPVLFLCHHCDDCILKMRWGKWSEVISFLDKYSSTADRHQTNLLQALEREAVEEVCFRVAQKLSMPLDESRWCPVAIELTVSLCKSIARTEWQNLDSQLLAKAFIDAVANAGKEIRMPKSLDRLAFNMKEFEDPFLSTNCNEISKVDGERNKSDQRVVMMKTEDQSPAEVPNKNAAFVGLYGCPVSVETGTTIEKLHTNWYLARQVFFVATVLSEGAVPGRSIVSKEDLYACLYLEAQYGEAALSKPILPPRVVQSLSSPKPKKGRKKSPGPSSPVRSTEAPKERVNNALFWHIVWAALAEKHGWHLEHGNRPNDFYFCPHGVTRGKGFRPRIDFFDSVPLVLSCLRTSPDWRDKPEIRSIVQEYEDCKDFYDKVKGSKEIPKFTDKKNQAKWLREQVKANKN